MPSRLVQEWSLPSLPAYMGDNLTLHTGPIPLDARLPDEDIIPIIWAAYGQDTLEEVATQPAVLSRGQHNFSSAQATRKRSSPLITHQY